MECLRKYSDGSVQAAHSTFCSFLNRRRDVRIVPGVSDFDDTDYGKRRFFFIPERDSFGFMARLQALPLASSAALRIFLLVRRRLLFAELSPQIAVL